LKNAKKNQASYCIKKKDKIRETFDRKMLIKIFHPNIIRSFTLFSFIIFGVLLAVSCDSPGQKNLPASANANTAPVQVVSTNKPKIVAFGDSLTAGLGLLEKESYPYLLQQKLQAEGYDYEVINAGVSGDTSSGGLDRIDLSLNQKGVEILILELGANDILRGLPIDQMKHNLSEIIKRAKAKNVKVLLCGMYSPLNQGGERLREIAKTYKDLAAEHKVEFLPFFLEGVGGQPNLNQADGIHPNAEGASKITDTVHKAVVPLLKKT
jgi:acyl-CoA thioesterase-1